MASLVFAACSDPPVALFVDLRTDYVGGVEARLARVQLFAADAETAVRSVETPLIEEDLTEGVRIAELDDLTPGPYRVVVALEGLARVPVRTVRITIDRSRAVTVLITRDCQTIACPTDDAPELSECLGGACVDPTCAPETPQSCPAPECMSDTDCASSTVACATAVCVAGVCSLRADSAMCAMAEYCEPTMGCRIRPGLPMDGGTDAGMDGAADAATDGGHDALTDGGGDGGDADGGPMGVVAIAAGYGHSCAIVRGGELYCWGSNARGELGDPSFSDNALVPRRIGTDSDWTDIAVGGRYFGGGPIGFSCGIRGGELYCWGKNENGELGNGTMVDADAPTPVGTGTDWFRVVGSWAHAHGLRGAGELWSWGEGVANGLGNDMDQPSPMRVGTALWREVSAGTDHGCGIQMDGSLWCWGNGLNGALALGTGRTYELTPQRVGAANDWHGLTRTCALRTGGALWCWGSNSEGRVGDGTTDDAFAPLEIATSGYAEVAATYTLTYAVASDGALATWGDDDNGALGNGSAGAGMDVLVPTIVDARSGWRLVTPGILHGCAALGSSEVYCWGLSQDGRTGLGDGAPTVVVTPTALTFAP